MNTIHALAQNHFAFALGYFPFILVALALWSLGWKGVALWFAARNHQKKWFILILILNTLGIVDIIYLIWFRRDKQEGVTQSLFNNPLPDPEAEDEVVAESAAT